MPPNSNRILDKLQNNLNVEKITVPSIEKLKNSRVLTIKSKYYDASSKGLKELVPANDLYNTNKK